MSPGNRLIPLRELCQVFTDGNWVETKDQSPTGVRLIQTGNVGTGIFKNRLSKARFVSEKTFQDMKCTEILPGDCLISRLPDPVGRACIVPNLPGRMITAVDCSILRLDLNKILPNYFTYYAQSAEYFREVETYCTGATRKRISRKNLGKIKIPVPTVADQKRIVSMLDEAFAGIETAIANTEKNLANARELFEGYADRTVAELSGERLCLKDCVEQVSTGPFGSLLHKSDYVSDGSPLVNPINIVDSRILADDKKRVDKATLVRLSAYVLRKGDVVVARRGEIGRCAVVEPEQDGWLCGTGCFFVRPKKELNPHFLVNLLRSETGRSELLRRATGATMKNLGNKALATLELRLPPRELQDRMIEQLAELQNANNELTHVFRRKLKSLNELKQSLLQKAFSGELTAGRAERDLAEASS